MQPTTWKHLLFCGLTVALMPASAAAKKAEAPAYEYGPAPDWNEYKALAENAVRQRLIDPGSAEFSWNYGYYKSYWKPLLQGKVFGYVACGQVNARNRMGGFAGRNYFAVVIDRGSVRFVELGDGGPYDLVAMGCTKAVQRGVFPALPAMASAPSPAEPQLGYAIKPMAEGAYVSVVTPGSAADKAGLQPGMVITAVNGVSLTGMGETMPRIIAAASGRVTLALIGGKQIVIERALPANQAQ